MPSCPIQSRMPEHPSLPRTTGSKNPNAFPYFFELTKFRKENTPKHTLCGCGGKKKLLSDTEFLLLPKIQAIECVVYPN